MKIEIGDKITLSEEVTDELTAAHWGSGSLPVYATPAMTLLVERAAVKLLEGKLDEGMTTVGQFKHFPCVCHSRRVPSHLPVSPDRDQPEEIRVSGGNYGQ